MDNRLNDTKKEIEKLMDKRKLALKLLTVPPLTVSAYEAEKFWKGKIAEICGVSPFLLSGVHSAKVVERNGGKK